LRIKLYLNAQLSQFHNKVIFYFNNYENKLYYFGVKPGTPSSGKPLRVCLYVGVERQRKREVNESWKNENKNKKKI